MDDFTKKRFESFAVAFVDAYEDSGAKAAGALAVRRMLSRDFKIARDFVTEEFKSRGYQFIGEVEDGVGH